MTNKYVFYPTASEIAERLYAHKTRSGSNRPYIEHPFMLVAILKSAGYDQDLLLCGALLHDAIEENDHSPAVIESLRLACSPELLALIDEVTDTPGLDRESRRAEQAQRAKSYTRFAALIRLADKLANITDILESPPQWAPKHIISYCEFAMKIVDICRHVDPAIGAQCDKAFAQVLEKYPRKIKANELSDHRPR